MYNEADFDNAEQRQILGTFSESPAVKEAKALIRVEAKFIERFWSDSGLVKAPASTADAIYSGWDMEILKFPGEDYVWLSRKGWETDEYCKVDENQALSMLSELGLLKA